MRILSAKDNRSRSHDRPITERDKGTFVTDLLKVAIFHEKPLKVEVPGIGKFKVGEGLGGFSWSLFVRGDDCTACGRCCYGAGHRRIWLWGPKQKTPKGLPRIKCRINGEKVKIPYHMQQSGRLDDKCDYLVPAEAVQDGRYGSFQPMEKNGILMQLCALHGDEDPMSHQDRAGIRNYDVKPLHCALGIFMVCHKLSNLGRKRWIYSRRPIPRNHRWPQCPIDLVNLPISDEVIENDKRNWEAMIENYGWLPGSRMKEGYKLWKKLIKSPPESTILFEDVWK